MNHTQVMVCDDGQAYLFLVSFRDNGQNLLESAWQALEPASCKHHSHAGCSCASALCQLQGHRLHGTLGALAPALDMLQLGAAVSPLDASMGNFCNPTARWRNADCFRDPV